MDSTFNQAIGSRNPIQRSVNTTKEFPMSSNSRALREAALAAALAPQLASAQPYYNGRSARHHSHNDAQTADIALTGEVEGERVFDLPLTNGDRQRVLD